MDFVTAVKTCLISKYANFQGRASRSEFWFFILFFCIYAFLGGFLLGYAGIRRDTIDIALLVIYLPILIPSFAVAARRLHDMNQSGWIQCIFIPGFIADEFLGTGWIIYFLTLGLYIFWFSQKGNTSKNKYGPVPKK